MIIIQSNNLHIYSATCIYPKRDTTMVNVEHVKVKNEINLFSYLFTFTTLLYILLHVSISRLYYFVYCVYL